MIVNEQKITIISLRKKKNENINEALRWLGASLGLFNLRDKDQSCFRIFIELLKHSKSQEGLSSDELAYRLSLTRGTVMHHINRLMKSGIVISNRNKYSLRVDNLASLVDELEEDMKRTISDMKKVATDIDKYLGL
ncbi:MAG: ArsR/SmtB family transcription factor [Candidatus Woesearchaeota archaeon]